MPLNYSYLRYGFGFSMILLNVSISRKVSCLSKTYKIFHMNGQCGFYGDGTLFTQLKLEDCGKAFSCVQYG